MSLHRTGWKGEDDGRVRFGRKAKLWLASAIRERLTATDEKHPEPRVYGQELEDIVAWYCEEPMFYVTWVPAAEYRGRGFSHGAWQLDYAAINRDFKLGRKVCLVRRTLEIDNARIKSLDEWLRADIAGTLKCPGRFGGTEELSAEVVKNLSSAAANRRKRWPRRCVQCDRSFKPDHHKATRCPSCRAERRAPTRRARASH